MKVIVTDSEQKHKSMMTEPIARLVGSLAVPTVMTQLITVAYNTADTYFVSQISTSASAAVGVVFSLMSLIQAIGFGYAMGAQSLISRCLGNEHNEEANKYGSTALASVIAVGLLISALGLVFLQPLMKLLGSTPTMLKYCCDYAKIILIAAPIMCASFVLNGILRSEGEAFFSMIGLCTGGILNIGLDPLFIFVFNMGVSGAALATAISQSVGFFILLSVFLRKKSIVKISVKSLSRRPSDYFKVIYTGLPTVARQGMASVASAMLNTAAGNYSDAAVAAVTIANKVYLLVRNVIIGIGQGYTPVAGYNYGGGNKKRVKQAFRFTLLTGTALCMVFAIVVYIFSRDLTAWFRSDGEVIRIGSEAMRFAAMVMPFMAYSTYVNQTYQSLGFSLGATLLALCRQGIFFIPLILILPKFFGLTGVEAAQPLSDFLTFVVSVPAQLIFFSRKLKT